MQAGLFWHPPKEAPQVRGRRLGESKGESRSAPVYTNTTIDGNTHTPHLRVTITHTDVARSCARPSDTRSVRTQCECTRVLGRWCWGWWWVVGADSVAKRQAPPGSAAASCTHGVSAKRYAKPRAKRARCKSKARSSTQPKSEARSGCHTGQAQSAQVLRRKGYRRGHANTQAQLY